MQIGCKNVGIDVKSQEREFLYKQNKSLKRVKLQGIGGNGIINQVVLLPALQAVTVGPEPLTSGINHFYLRRLI